MRMDSIDLINIRLVTVAAPIIKKGIDASGSIHDISIDRTSLSKIAIPVTPPSKKPFGSKKAFNPTLDKKIAKAICKNSEK